MTAAALPASTGVPTHMLPPPSAQQQGIPGRPASRSTPAQTAALQVVPALPVQEAAANPSQMENIQNHPKWALLAKLPTRLNVGIPLPHFKVRDLLALKQGQLIKSSWESTTDVLLKAGGVPFSFSEFEVVEQRMAVRITRLA